jgi:hypothetical protein
VINVYNYKSTLYINWFSQIRYFYEQGSTWRSRHSGLLRPRRFWVQNPVGTRKFSFSYLPDWSWGPPRLPYNGYRGSFPVGKQPKRAVDKPPSFSADVRNSLAPLDHCIGTLRGDLYIHQYFHGLFCNA